MLEIRKVTPSDNPRAPSDIVCNPDSIVCNPDNIVCRPGNIVCNPGNIVCNPGDIVCNPGNFVCNPGNIACNPSLECLPLAWMDVSGTYKNPSPPSGHSSILELRVDVDRQRPQHRVSGDFFDCESSNGEGSVLYTGSFVVESLTITEAEDEIVIKGPVRYFNDPTQVNDTIQVRIARPSADAIVKSKTSGTLISTYLCPRVSESFRDVTLEIDRFQGTTFPPTVNTHVNPHPADLADEDLTTELVFRRAGIDMTVSEDDVLNDPDSGDPGSDWDSAELHDLMEDRFDHFENSLQWSVYGVVVPDFEIPGVRGVMFDVGGVDQEPCYRQGAAFVYNGIQSSTLGTLYNTNAQKDRLFLRVVVHELGHTFNLPHPEDRTSHKDLASRSFMNYPWKYTGGGGATAVQKATNYWSDFRWEFDDVELTWMRHQDRNDVIFGGNDFIGDNLSIYTEPVMEIRGDSPLSLEVRAWDVFDFAQPVRVELRLKNISETTQKVSPFLAPEDGLVTLYIRRPNGDRVRYIPPVRRLRGPDEVKLAPGEALYESVLLSFGARGPQFREPGEYRVRAFYDLSSTGMVVSRSHRLRIATPLSRSTEELAHLLFSHEAMKFLYFGGTERYPEATSRLEEAVEKYAETDPTVIRHIHAALGRHQSRPFKRVVRKDGQRMVTLREANLEEAVIHLEAAHKLLPTTKTAALDHISYNRLSVLLAECYEKQDNMVEAARVLRETLRYFEKQRVVESVLDDYQKRIDRLSR
jgi:hypothetical protein